MQNFDIARKGMIQNSGNFMVPKEGLPRGRFIDSTLRLLPIDAGLLYPFFVDEALPGDLLRYNVRALIRMQTPVVPLFSNQRLELFGFAVPYRLLDDNFRKMMGQQANPADSIAFVTPKLAMTVGGFTVGSIFDFMGLPTIGGADAAGVANFCIYPLRAYNRIWNEYFRSQNLQNSIDMLTTNPATETPASFVTRRVAKLPDFFTRALPWPQKFTSPSLFPSALAPVKGIGVDTTNRTASGTDINVLETPATETGTPPAAFYDFQQQITNATNWYIRSQAATATAAPLIYADLAASTGITINAFRQSMLVQYFLEKSARGGTRYTEVLLEQFGVRSPDARMQRPEFIGGGRIPISITPVAQTTPVAGGGTDGVGELAGSGNGMGSADFSYAATEHSVILILGAVRTEQLYQQGVHPMWFRDSQFDFAWPVLCGMGEEPVLTKHLYFKGTGAPDEVVFGYNPRYEPYRRLQGLGPSTAGVFRSTSAAPIDQWHLGQVFTAPPTLGDTFIRDEPPMARVLQLGASTGQQYRVEASISRDATRQLSVHGLPSSIVRM